MERINSITTASVGADKNAAKKLAEGSDIKLYLYRVAGVVMSLERGEAVTGEYVALRGHFTATNKQAGSKDEGKEFTSDVCFLPTGAHDNLVNTVIDSGVEWDRPNKKTDKLTGYLTDGKSVLFARDVYVHRDKTPSGVAFLTREIFTSVESPMDLVRTTIASVEESARKSAPAPAPAPAPAGKGGHK